MRRSTTFNQNEIKELTEELNGIAIRIRTVNRQLTNAIRRIQRMAIKDDLTGLYNRRYAIEQLNQHWAEAKRYNHTFSCVMTDVDDFKAINDKYGHLEGDSVLVRLGRSLSEITRESDIVCRFGGDEFMVLLPDQSEESAAAFAFRCRESLKDRLSVGGENQLCPTISFGVAGMTPEMVKPLELIDAADRALYVAKQFGKNKIIRNSECYHNTKA